MNYTSSQGRAISLRRTGVELYGAASGGYDGCCPPVVDPYTLLALLVGIALATYFLNVLINVTAVSTCQLQGDYGDYGEYLSATG